MIASRKWMLVPLLLGVGACTPLGLWVYDDPVVTVARVTLELNESRRLRAAPLVVALAVDNPNGFDLSTERVELSLRLDGAQVGQLKQDSTVPVPMAAVSTVALALPLAKRTGQETLAALASGTHTFSVRGRATFRTPFGTRKVRFAQEGAMRFGERPAESSP